MTIFASDTERDLVTAASAFLKLADLSHDNLLRKEMAAYLARILRTYDPKPEPVPVIPAWEEFTMNKLTVDEATMVLFCNSDVKIQKSVYEAIRALTSKAPTE